MIITAFSKLEESHEIDTLIEAGKPEAITILICTTCCKTFKYWFYNRTLNTCVTQIGSRYFNYMHTVKNCSYYTADFMCPRFSRVNIGKESNNNEAMVLIWYLLSIIR